MGRYEHKWLEICDNCEHNERMQEEDWRTGDMIIGCVCELNSISVPFYEECGIPLSCPYQKPQSGEDSG